MDDTIDAAAFAELETIQGPPVDLDPPELAWSHEQPIVDYPPTGADPALLTQPWSHTISLGAAITGAAAAAVTIAVIATSGHPAPTPKPPAAAPTTTILMPAPTTTITTVPTQTPQTPQTTPTLPPAATYTAPPFDPDIITAAQRRAFDNDVTSRQINMPHDRAYNIAVQTCLDLNVLHHSVGTVTTGDLQTEEASWVHPGGIPTIADAALLIGAATRNFPNCY